jgi:hypothetical protein
MPELPAVPNVLKFQLVWKAYSDVTAMTVHYFQYSGGPPSPANCASMASNMVTVGQIEFQALADVNSGQESCTCTDLSSPTAGQGAGGTPWVGTRSGSSLSPATAILVRHTINRRYRGGKPRSYLPLGTSSDVTTAGLWSNAFVSAVDSAWGSFAAGMLASGAGCTITNIVNVSYYKGSTVFIKPSGRAENRPTPRASPLVDQILGHISEPMIASQRRRNRNA